MANYNYIPIKELANTLKIHYNTLRSWLGHYSLAKYVTEMLNDAGKLERYFRMSKTSTGILRRYLVKKNKINLADFDKLYFKINK